MSDKMTLTTQKKWRKPFLKRPEVILVVAYIVAAIIWEFGASTVISHAPLYTEIKNAFAQWKP
ncbi:MAG: hypothetical protein ACQESI_01580 [Pseudomonadota bacterium]